MNRIDDFRMLTVFVYKSKRSIQFFFKKVCFKVFWIDKNKDYLHLWIKTERAQHLDIDKIDTLFCDFETNDEDDDYLLMAAEKVDNKRVDDKKEVKTIFDDEEDEFFILADQQYQENLKIMQHIDSLPIVKLQEFETAIKKDNCWLNYACVKKDRSKKDFIYH